MFNLTSAVYSENNIHRTVNYDLFMIHGGSSRANGANIILVGSECRIGDYAGYLQFEVNDPEQTNGYGILNFSTQHGLTQTLKSGVAHNISDAAIASKNLNNNGYIQFACGLYFQWGNTAISSNKTSVDVVLPIKPSSGWIRQTFLTQNGTAFNNSLCYLDTVFDRGVGTFRVGRNPVSEYSEWFSYFIIWC